MFAFLCCDFLRTLHDCMRGFVYIENTRISKLIFIDNILQHIKIVSTRTLLEPEATQWLQFGLPKTEFAMTIHKVCEQQFLSWLGVLGTFYVRSASLSLTPSFTARCKSSCFNYLDIHFDFLFVIWKITSPVVLCASRTTGPNYTHSGAPNYKTRYKGRHVELP
jgi:hypothetical protein